jgi:uncharacterized protein YdeI (YjbR/CyaY-like superfamily)
VNLPEDITKAFTAAGIIDVFHRLPPSHQREYLSWIQSAKHADTRGIRIGQAAKMIRDKARA